jgi:hypothetical protein
MSADSYERAMQARITTSEVESRMGWHPGAHRQRYFPAPAHSNATDDRQFTWRDALFTIAIAATIVSGAVWSIRQPTVSTAPPARATPALGVVDRPAAVPQQGLEQRCATPVLTSPIGTP